MDGFDMDENLLIMTALDTNIIINLLVSSATFHKKTISGLQMG